jgi:hypothetical protein
MKFKPDTLASVHEQMALVKAQSTAGFLTNYFRQEMVGPRILLPRQLGASYSLMT